MKFNSPFVNLFIRANDYIKLLSDLSTYMAFPLRFVEENDPFYGEVDYPTAYLGDIKIYFMHYKDKDEAIEAWERRKNRINWNNIWVIFTDRDGCTKDDLLSFDALPYNHKVVFTNKVYSDIKSSFYIRGFEKENEVGILSDMANPKIPIKRYIN